MIDLIEVEPHDRVLLLTASDIPLATALAARAARGGVVCLGADETVRAARRQTAHLDNLMFITAAPEEIPWKEGFFTRVVDPVGGWAHPERAARELARVTSPGGTAYLAAAAPDALAAAGFLLVSSGDLLVMRRR